MATITGERVNEATYRGLAILGENKRLELYLGQPREKPPMSVEHGRIEMRLLAQLLPQLDSGEFTFRVEHGRLRVSAETYDIPDLAIIPVALERALLERPRSLDAYADPLPLVIEVWSPSTGDYDVAVKLADYQRWGDLEIWFLHPYERTLTAWRRQPDGSYNETVYRDGVAQPESLPVVTLDLDELFAP